jgi:hypothetical protein
MTIDVPRTREKLQAFDLRGLFVEQLGWNQPPRGLAPTTWDQREQRVTRTPIAELAGVIVFEVTTANGSIPDELIRRSIQAEIDQYHHEHLLIFLNAERSSSLWYWIKRDGGKSYPRRHIYVQGQPGDLLIGKLSAMFVDIGELDVDGKLRLVEAISRVRQALDVEPVTRRFFSDFQRLHGTLLDAITGVADERDRRWYASVLLNRLMFVYFLQRRGFLDGGNYRYLQQRLAASQDHGPDQYYREFLQALFFEGFAKLATDRDAQAQALIGNIRYLNGGLFLPHQVEQTYRDIAVPDQVFGEILSLFEGYDWVLDDTPTGSEREINPAVLGYIFEKYINQKAFGAYYTRTEITEYLCEQTIHRLILDKVNETLPAGVRPYETVGDLLLKPTAATCRVLLLRILPELRLIDPACGSGAFLVAAMRTLIAIYSALVGKARFAHDPTLDSWLAQVERDHPNIDYYIKKQIIVNNLYGVDIMAEAIEIARLRLFLALVAAARTVDDLEPLPNIDFNILAGNSLIGLLRVDDQRADQKRKPVEQLSLFDTSKRENYRQVVAEKNRLVASYRDAAERLRAENLSALRDDIERHRTDAAELLDELLLDDFQSLGIRYEEATWDVAKGKEGKPKRRALTLADIRALQPFHWGYEFDEVINERGGFDAIITNPPWETLKPQAKEFFDAYSDLVSTNKMSIKDFEREQAKLLQVSEIHSAWLEYLSRFPHQSEYFRSTLQFQHQSAVVLGKRTGTDINFYKLFVEQCYNLLHDGGQCGIVVPSGIYTDMGSTGLRALLFEQAQVRSILSVSNERFLFEGVDHRFKYVFLTFEKGGQTRQFDAAFRINPREAVGAEQIDAFLNSPDQHMTISLDVVRQLSSETLSVMEFRSALDIKIAQKLVRFPSLGVRLDDTWNLVLTNEFHMTNDSRLFKTQPGAGRLPLVEGKMFHQYSNALAKPKYWIDEQEGRTALLGRISDTGQKLAYQSYRLAFRDVARSTDERTLIATVLHPGVFCPHTVSLEKDASLSPTSRLFLVVLLNSLVLDYLVRQRVSAHVSFFFVHQLPVPRLTESDPHFAPIVARAAKLICTTPEYDDLAKEVGLGDHRAGVTDPAERNRLRAELDAMVAHLYELGESELTHILGSFPLVEQAQKDAVLVAFHAFAPHPDNAQVAALIADGEGERVEFKVAALWNAKTNQKDGSMRENVVQAIAAYLNSYEGGAVIVGVENGTNSVVGLADDYAAANPHKRDRDGYELWLRDVIGAGLGQTFGVYLSISFHSIGGAEVCRIQVRPADRPAYYSGDLYVRIGNGKKKLSAQQAMEYVRGRW